MSNIRSFVNNKINMISKYEIAFGEEKSRALLFSPIVGLSCNIPVQRERQKVSVESKDNISGSHCWVHQRVSGIVPLEFTPAAFRLIGRLICFIYDSTTSYDKVNDLR